eukprot:CAMPEP_0113541820 /NCGR_PEP_ID=MMETSP0015_2-20120614/9256_1 /TAXON_ID=2838 /ORGANISM="Odontella" /LENGTH=107 /DNA_ID=CAMNT_0000441793 /DNA_START=99 /DNA_END=422 /DNA_ORIENTATION=- /assembly_acc=CAM_ASM_000160
MPASAPSNQADDPGTDLMEALVRNAELVQVGGPSPSPSPSPCEVQCRAQQDAIVRCVETIRKSREQDSDGSPGPPASLPVECLSPAVSAWTSCCADANENGVVMSGG